VPRQRIIVLVALLAVGALAGCSGDDDAGPTTTTGRSATTTPATGGVDRPLVPIADAATRDDATPIRVEGVLFVTDTETRLCGAIGESSPVQCLGDSIAVGGVDPADYALGDGGPGVMISAGPVIVAGIMEDGVLVAD
jgi:hypothetical protein